MRKSRYFLFFIFSFTTVICTQNISAQTARVKGTVSNEKGAPAPWVNIVWKGTKVGTPTDANGHYQLQLPAGKKIRLSVTFIGYMQQDTTIFLKAGEIKVLNFSLKPISTNLPGLEIHDEQLRTENIVRLNPRDVLMAPTISSGVEDLVKTLPGVSSSNELSSEYSVRGGNFDENLVYVNGIEIYRPFLVNSGRQEGLSFINPNLVSSIKFSAGGFGAQYGDKMSSVLDVHYRNPDRFGGSVSASLLGADFSVQGITNNKKFSFLIGTRYKTNRYLLNSLETKGNYLPKFLDFQSLMTYHFNKHWQLSLLAYYARNLYRVIPENRQTDFGTVQQSLRFTVYFDGEEKDKYETGQAGLTLTYQPNQSTSLKFIVSGFQSYESETYDIQGQYWIGQVENRKESRNEGEAIATLGVGTYLQHARNYFNSNVLSMKHLGVYLLDNQTIKWGLRYQHQQIDDRLREWELNDSADYTLPHPPDNPGNPNPQRPGLDLYYFARAHNKLNINRISAFASDRWNFILKNKSLFTITAGSRFYYWDFANEFLVSPRINVSYKPFSKPGLTFRFASGIYYQPPFYREMRDMDGSLNNNPRSQRSIQFILGNDYRFQLANRPFIFTTELYFKKLDHLIPYELDDVRIRYYAKQTAKGYATGVDFKLYGEFVKGIDSWITLSLMKTAEDVMGDFYYDYYDKSGQKITGTNTASATDSVRIEPGYIPRPTDRRLNFTIYFQDYIPNHEQFKVHLRFLYGSGLPFGPPHTQRYLQTLRMPPYRRVDIGFSWNPLDKQVSRLSRHSVHSMWLTLEVFNLFQVYNTISYNWIKDVYNHQFAIPNYLTTRRVNLKLVMNF